MAADGGAGHEPVVREWLRRRSASDLGAGDAASVCEARELAGIRHAKCDEGILHQFRELGHLGGSRLLNHRRHAPQMKCSEASRSVVDTGHDVRRVLDRPGRVARLEPFGTMGDEVGAVRELGGQPPRRPWWHRRVEDDEPRIRASGAQRPDDRAQRLEVWCFAPAHWTVTATCTTCASASSSSLVATASKPGRRRNAADLVPRHGPIDRSLNSRSRRSRSGLRHGRADVAEPDHGAAGTAGLDRVPSPVSPRLCALRRPASTITLALRRRRAPHPAAGAS